MSKVSVIMAVFNGERFIKESIESVLKQKYSDFELIIVDDCSLDQTSIIIHSYQDPRINYYKNKKNCGQTISLNRCLGYAKSEYVTVIDADDIYLANRFEDQIDFLEHNEKAGLVGGGYLIIDENSNELSFCVPKDTINNNNIQYELLKDNIFGHGAVMYRKSCLATVGPYRKEFAFAQDYDLFLRISEHYQLGVMQKVLYKYRLSLDQKSIKFYFLQNEYAKLARELAKERRRYGYEKFTSMNEEERMEFLNKRFLRQYKKKENKLISLGYLKYAYMFSTCGRFLESFCLLKQAINLAPLYFIAYWKWLVTSIRYLLFKVKSYFLKMIKNVNMLS